MKGKILRSLVAVVLAIALCTQMAAPITTEAASKKTITAAKKESKAKSVKTGTTTVKMNEGTDSYYKFTAKKSGTYVITISNIKGVGNSSDSINGHMNIGTVEEDGYISYYDNKYKTQGGKTTTFWLSSKSFYNSYKTWSNDSKVDSYLTKRTITVKLEKGQTIYFYNYFLGSSSKIQYTLNIKKKK